MTDHLINWAPWIVSAIVALFGIRLASAWELSITKSFVMIGVLFVVTGVVSSRIAHGYLRSQILENQMEPLEQMTLRNDFALRHVEERNLHAADSLLFQVIAEATQIEKSRWTLFEVEARCEKIRRDANRLSRVVKSELRAIEREQRERESALVRERERERKAIESRHRSIAQRVWGIVVAAQPTATEPKRHGRAMVWDFTKDNVEDAYEMLPDDLRADSQDGVLTMFCIRNRVQIEVGRYSISNEPAYKERMDIAVVYWPSRECPGVWQVFGGEPAARRPVTYSPGYGSSVHIKEWIEGLVEGQPIAARQVPEDPAAESSSSSLPRETVNDPGADALYGQWRLVNDSSKDTLVIREINGHLRMQLALGSGGHIAIRSPKWDGKTLSYSYFVPRNNFTASLVLQLDYSETHRQFLLSGTCESNQFPARKWVLRKVLPSE